MDSLVNMMIKSRLQIASLLTAIFLLAQTTCMAADFSVPVLLTFDTEDDRDAVAVKELAITEPSTYFFTGQFIESHSQLVADLAERNTVGSHSYSHAHLTELDSVELRKELLVSKMLLEDATGRPPTWFRAPYLEYNSEVMSVLKELGYRYDSSDQERWTSQDTLIEIPISSRDKSDQLVSDYDLFERGKMDAADALAWLQARYQERSSTGRPLVFLMHPRIIAEHKQVLHDFIDYVKAQGGYFLTADQWVERANAVIPERFGVWVDLSLGEHDVQQVVEDIRSARLTDVFLMARDPEGNDYFLRPGQRRGAERDIFGELVTELRRADIRVHAWLPVFRNPELAQREPRLAMVGDNGAPSIEWVSPFHPEVRQSLLDSAADLMRRYDLQGIHLDYVRYPSLGFDFSPTALEGFAKSQGVDEVTPASALSDRYSAWITWRADRIAAFIADMRQVVTTFGPVDAELSAALIADAALAHRSMEQYGQDYAQLAESLDLLIPMAYFKEERKTPDWIGQVRTTARFRTGEKSLLLGLAAYQSPQHWTLSKQQFKRSLSFASEGAEGIVLYPYLFLFGQGDEGWNMPSGSAGLLTDFVSSFIDRTNTASDPSRSSAKNTDIMTRADEGMDWNWVILIAAGFTLLLGLAALLRRGPRGVHTAPTTSSALSPIETDWMALQARLQVSALSIDDYHGVSGLLRQMGAATISTFRLARVLEVLNIKSQTAEQLTIETVRFPSEDRRKLRYLEEALLLGYAQLSDGRFQITPAGKNRLAQNRANGYSRDLLDFIEARLREKLVVSCPHCDGNTFGHWFWDDVECDVCGQNYRMEEAAHISIARAVDESSYDTPREAKVVSISDGDAGR